MTSEAYGGCDCDCAEQLDAALARIAHAGRGVVFYLLQEGRGAGFAAKARDRMLVQASGQRLTTFEAYAQMGLRPDVRRYDDVPALATLLGIRAGLLLLTNNPEKVRALVAAGATIARTAPLVTPPSPFNRHYLAAKSGAGHALEPDGRAPAPLPESVTAAAPQPLAATPRWIRLASYLLPLRLERPAWFRVHLYVDAEGSGERVVLTYGEARTDVAPLVRLERDTLAGRAGTTRARWLPAAARMVAHGAGCVLFLRPRGWRGTEGASRDVASLLAAHLPAGRAQLLLDEPTSRARPRLEGLLRAQGITLAAPAVPGAAA